MRNLTGCIFKNEDGFIIVAKDFGNNIIVEQYNKDWDMIAGPSSWNVNWLEGLEEVPHN